jgi:hypothetical protein
MKIVATMMVRDEADLVAAMVEYHVDQGVDLIIVTDNASLDGTTEILQAYADLGVVELHHDPVHRKQQGVLVTAMARRAFAEHGADWVLNLDADEFLRAVDPDLTVRQALQGIPVELGAFTTPVSNLVGAPAQRGSGVDRLTWRDLRTDDALKLVGINAQPTPNAVHRGDPEVTVSQGNHFVSLASAGQPDPAFALEVLHLPWRSWDQLERKVVNAGRAYTENPDLRPSRNHHGMADYRRHLGGRMRYYYLMRMPTRAELAAGEQDGTYVRDEWLRDRLHGLVDRARRPDLLAASLDASDDGVETEADHQRGADLARAFVELERERDEATHRAADLERALARTRDERDRARAQASLTAGDRVRRRAGRAVRGVRRRLPGSG